MEAAQLAPADLCRDNRPTGAIRRQPVDENHDGGGS